MSIEQHILFRTHQHWLPFFLRVVATFVTSSIVVGGLTYLLSRSGIITVVVLAIDFAIAYVYCKFFYARSYFVIGRDTISMEVRNGLFSRYNMSIRFAQIKDMAYSKNHFLHYVFGYGVLFVRSSAGSEWGFTVPNIPNIEEIYKKVNYLYSLTDEERKLVTELDTLDPNPRPRTREQAIEEAKQTLLSIEGIKEVVLLSDEDRRLIFGVEEDRNHGVYESIKRTVVFSATHDSGFRDADAPIVMKLGSKVIFPPVSFHELREKNVVSSSPGLAVHQYLSKKFERLETNDATLLIGFDL